MKSSNKKHIKSHVDAKTTSWSVKISPELKARIKAKQMKVDVAESVRSFLEELCNG